MACGSPLASATSKVVTSDSLSGTMVAAGWEASSLFPTIRSGGWNVKRPG